MIFILSLLISLSSNTQISKQEKVRTFKVGPLICGTKESVNPEELSVAPEYSFTCTKNKKRLFLKNNLSADIVTGTDDGKFILGVSNSGLHDKAFWILDENGNEIRSKTHDADGIKYCEKSLMHVKKWTKEDIQAKFKIEKGKLTEVTVNSCDNKRISIL